MVIKEDTRNFDYDACDPKYPQTALAQAPSSWVELRRPSLRDGLHDAVSR